MKQNQLGENITRFRKEKGLSQEKVAEYMGVSRQAVTKWESNSSKPSSDNLIKLAELFDVKVDVLLGDNEFDNMKISSNITPSKVPWGFIGVSVACVIAYIVIGSLLNLFSFGTLICMFIICFPIQLFLHIYFSNAVNKNSFTGIAGFDEKIEYNYDEVKKLLVQMDLHIGMSSSVYVFLMCALGCSQLNISWINALLLTMYILDFITIILFNNYKFIDRIYCNEVDKKRAIKGIPIIIIYLVQMLLGMGITIIVFEMKGIENNTAPAMQVAGLLLVGLLFATIGFFVESNHINKWCPGKLPYKIKKLSVVSWLMCLIFYVLMCIV